MTTLKPPLDPDCADEAPHADALTPYDMEHLATYIPFSTLKRMVPIGPTSRASCCTSIHRENLYALAARGRRTSPAPNG